MVKERDDGARESSIASGWTVEGQEVPQAAAASGAPTDPRPEIFEAPEGDEQTQLSAGALVFLGLIGGIYLLYSVVWFSWANHYSAVNGAVAEGSGTIGGVLQQLVFWIAPLAPALWFFSAMLLNRGAAFWRFVVWLLVGAVVLVPLPMFGGVF